jgi:hypothetical protein
VQGDRLKKMGCVQDSRQTDKQIGQRICRQGLDTQKNIFVTADRKTYLHTFVILEGQTEIDRHT